MSTYKSTSHALPEMYTQKGVSVAELSYRGPVLLVFLRHFGCTFCRETLQEISDNRKTFQQRGIEVVLVHMCATDIAQPHLDKYGLADTLHVGDPPCHFYKAFNLEKGNFNQLFGLQSWIRGFDAGIRKGHGVGYRQLGDGFQMPGVFVVQRSRVLNSYIHKIASDKPDYQELLSSCPS